MNVARAGLQHRRDRFVEELESYDAQVEELKTYGEIGELPLYLKKARNLSEKLKSAGDRVGAFNKEEKAFGWDTTQYPLREQVT